MAKGKRTYVWMYSEDSKIMWYVTNIQKRNFEPWEKLTLKKYDKKLRKHVVFKMKEIKKWWTKALGAKKK